MLPTHIGDLRMKRAAVYVRVSTDKQTIENQLREPTSDRQSPKGLGGCP